jgi:uncharacterized protein YhbP (UPF0306 family)
VSITLANSDHSSEHLQDVVKHILAASMSCAMATAGEDGAAHINAAFFAYDDDLQLFFLTHPESEHGRNILRGSTVAIAVHDDGQPWGAAHTGLQMFGRASMAEGEVDQQVRARYADRFPLFTEYVEGRLTEGAPEPSSSFFEQRFFVFRPDRLKILHEEEFGDEVLVHAQVTEPARR